MNTAISIKTNNLDTILEDIFLLHSENKFTRVDFPFFKDGRKFLISISIDYYDEFRIGAAYDGNICPYIYCTIVDLRYRIYNIDREFVIKESIKIKGPIIYGGYSVGEHLNYYGNTIFNVTDITASIINVTSAELNSSLHPHSC